MSDIVTLLNASTTSPMFNRLIQVLAEHKQGRASAAQWLSMIKAFTQRGVKQLELEEIGVGDFLLAAGDRVLTREELVSALEVRRTTVKEVVLERAQYSGWKQPGGRYEEALYIANAHVHNLEDEIEAVEHEMEQLSFEPERLSDEPELPLRLERRRADLLTRMKAPDAVAPSWAHFQTDAIAGRHGKRLIAHCRMTWRDDLLFIEEIQSDWAQRGRRYGWSNLYPRGPFVTNTEAWSGLVLRRTLQRAARSPSTARVAWITESMRNGGRQDSQGEQQAAVFQRAVAEEMKTALQALSASGQPEPSETTTAAMRASIETRLTTSGLPRGRGDASGLNEFYLRALPKLVDKLVAGTGEKVQVRELQLEDRQVQVPCLEITDAVRERLRQAQPVYSRALLASRGRPRPDDETLAQLIAQSAKMIGSPRHLRLLAHVYDVSTGAEVAGWFVNNFLDNPIQVSLRAARIDEAIDHECFHFAQAKLLTRAELAMLRERFAPGQPLNHRVRTVLTRRGDFALAAQCDDPDEASAQAFALWHRGHLEVDEPPVHGLFAGLVELTRDFVQWLRSKVEEHHLQSPQQVFDAFASGQLAARREESARSLDRSAHPSPTC